MKKGFMFSIEALLSITLVIAALVILNYSFTTAGIDNDATLIRAQAAGATAFYYNEPALAPTTNTSFCANIGNYNPTTKTLGSKQICRGYS